MEYDNKMFKSKTVELGGNKFKISHKSSNILSSNIWLLLGFVCYYVKIIHKLTLKPILKIIYEWTDFLLVIFSSTVLMLLIISFVTFAITSNYIDQIIHSCSTKNIDCFDIIKYCEEEFNSFINDLEHNTDILYTCLNKTSNYFYQYFYHFHLLLHLSLQHFWQCLLVDNLYKVHAVHDILIMLIDAQ